MISHELNRFAESPKTRSLRFDSLRRSVSVSILSYFHAVPSLTANCFPCFVELMGALLGNQYYSTKISREGRSKKGMDARELFLDSPNKQMGQVLKKYKNWQDNVNQALFRTRVQVQVCGGLKSLCRAKLVR